MLVLQPLLGLLSVAAAETRALRRPQRPWRAARQRRRPASRRHVRQRLPPRVRCSRRSRRAHRQPGSPMHWSRSTAKSDQHRLLFGQREALRPVRGRAGATPARPASQMPTYGSSLVEREKFDEVVRSAPASHEADLLPHALAEIEVGSWTCGPARTLHLAAEDGDTRFADTLRTAAERARRACCCRRGCRRRTGALVMAVTRGLPRGRARARPQVAELADRLAEALLPAGEPRRRRGLLRLRA